MAESQPAELVPCRYEECTDTLPNTKQDLFDHALWHLIATTTRREQAIHLLVASFWTGAWVSQFLGGDGTMVLPGWIIACIWAYIIIGNILGAVHRRHSPSN